MERVNQILRNSVYQCNLKEIEVCEKGRIFCRHNMAHFLDVARIGMILNLKENLGIEEELLYAAALLHDIGRHEQYRNQIPHEEASAIIAKPILKDCGFMETESKQILEAIRSHRDCNVQEQKNLAGILYRADKKSRACFSCPAVHLCDWDESKKNMQL